MSDPGHAAYRTFKNAIKCANGAGKAGEWKDAVRHAERALKAANRCKELLELLEANEPK